MEEVVIAGRPVDSARHHVPRKLQYGLRENLAIWRPYLLALTGLPTPPALQRGGFEWISAAKALTTLSLIASD